MCDHENLRIHVHQTSRTNCYKGKVDTRSSHTIDRVYVLCADCGKSIAYKPTPSLPVHMVKEKAVNWFYLAAEGAAPVWLKSLRLAMTRNNHKLAGNNLSNSDRRRLTALVQSQEEEIAQVEELIRGMEQ